MTSVRMKLVEEAFLAAASAPIEEREAIIVQRCDGDAQAAEEVRSLLAHNDTAGDQFLDTNEVRRMSAAEPESALTHFHNISNIYEYFNSYICSILINKLK